MLLGLLAKPPVLSVQAVASGGHASVSFQSQAALGAVDVGRAGDEIVVRIDGQSDGTQPQQQTSPLIRSLTLDNEGSRLVARIRVAAGTAHEIRRDAQSLTILLEPSADAPATERQPAGAPEASSAELYQRLLPVSSAATTDARPTPSDAQAVEGRPIGTPEASSAELYQRLFPGSSGAATSAADVGGGGAAAASMGTASPGRGLMLGRVTLLPWLNVGYIDAEYLPPGGTAQRQRFFQVQPRLDASAPIGAGSARVGYEPRFREGSSDPTLRKVSHLADASLSLPLGGNFEMGLSDHFSHGVLETDEVDPGREYFSNLATFTAQQLQASVRFDLGANLNLGLSAHRGTVRFAQPSGFFNYDSRGASGNLGRELTPNLRLAVGASYEEIDAPNRPEASMHAFSANAQLNGDITPLTHGSIVLGWTRQQNPQAPAEARHFDGLTANASIRRELGYSSTIGLTVTRATHPSGFEDNGFFVTTSGQLELALPLPFGVSFRGGTGYHVNQYAAVAPEIGRPRKDQITYWSIGLGRAVSRWGFWRLDYRKEARDSNIDAFDHVVNTFSVRVGVGYFEEAKR